jgi:hypothetical protein
MGADGQSTTIRVPASVRAALDRYRKPGQTYAALLEELVQELERVRRQERRERLRQLLREAGIQYASGYSARSTAVLHR